MAKPSTLEVQKAQEALASHHIYVLREILVERVGGSLVLSGCVDSFYHKQQAQEVVIAAVGRCDVINVIEVHASPALVETGVPI
jgi:hypothetical protein